MPYADLHVHTDRSDGTLSLDVIPATAREAGVSVVGLTDHERLQPFSEPIVEREGVRLVNGIEVRVELDGGERVDLLGYGIRDRDGLSKLCSEIQRSRVTRGHEIVEAVEAHIGVDLGVDIRPGIGRPHIARSVVDHPAVDLEYEEVFEELIGNGRSCYVPRWVPSFEAGIEVLKSACSIVSLAHPLRYPDIDTVERCAPHVDAIERFYPYDDDVDVSPILAIGRRFDLLETGGSDAHDERLGVAGLSRSKFEVLGLDDDRMKSQAEG